MSDKLRQDLMRAAAKRRLRILFAWRRTWFKLFRCWLRDLLGRTG